MTKCLIKKEFLLTAHPMTFVFTFFGIMLIIPNYIYYVAFFYTTLGIFFDFMNGRENRDTYFNAILPVSKKEVVKAKTAFVWIIETASVVFAVPFAILSRTINPNGSNLAGIEANVAFFGLSLIMYSLFNAVFLNEFFKTAYKAGKAFIFGSIATAVFVLVAETADHMPVIGDYLEGKYGQLIQLPLLFVGIAIFTVSFFVVNIQCAKKYEKVDL
ncbi:MAG TPA: hypothetical protein DCY31_09135 [Ruminococcaceae bacterium]|nr:hypothetical protein [Oscillospiraceae bacterium]